MLLNLLLGGCATNIEPTSQKNNPAKVNDKIKIIYSDPNEIYIMAKANPLSLTKPELWLEKPKEEFIKTALNHCSIYKKNSYHFWKPANPIPYKFSVIVNDYYTAYAVSKSDMYDWSRIRYKNKNYQGYRFVCANSENEASKVKVNYRISWSSYNFKWALHKGQLKSIESKRFISEQEIAENKRKKIEEEKRLAELKKQMRKKLEKELEPKFGNLCIKNQNNNKFLKGSEKYIDCLIEEDNKAQARKIEKDREERRKKAELEKKLAAMTPTERHAYNCSETFNFKKGTEQFNNCVFELYKAELDIQKLELEKELAEAKAKAASSEQARAEAVAKAQVAAANANRRAANLNSSMQLMKLSNSLINGSQQQSTLNNSNFRLKTTCSNVGGFLTCF